MSQREFWTDTLKEGRERFFQEAEKPKGSFCPCCGRFGKIYKRKLNKPMAESLVWVYSQTVRHGEKYYSIGDKAPRHVVRNGGSLASNRWWGLVEQEPNEDESKHTSGNWKITDKGMLFIRDEITVPKYCTTYNTKALAFSDEHTDIVGALGRPFHYRDLMEEPV